MKLNLGCKDKKLEGFENLDKIYGWTFQEGLPQYPDSSVDAITISHALMFLTNKELFNFLNEAFRVLRAGGIIRITEDDTENPGSDTYKTGNIKSGAVCLTGPNMMRSMLEAVGFRVFDVNEETTNFIDNSLLQNYHGGSKRCFFIEGQKNSKLMEGFKVIGSPTEIADVSRDDLPIFFKEMGFKVGAEVGVYKGEFSEKIAKSGLKLFCIDPWKNYEGFENPRGQERQDFLYQHTQRVLAPYPNAEIIRKTSMEAVNDFADESLDFVYIDGNHDFKYIAEDLAEWSKKVKKGGIVSGHDYFFTKTGTNEIHWHVAYVLNAFIKAYDIPNWYILGSENPKEGEKRDKWRSWMFVK